MTRLIDAEALKKAIEQGEGFSWDSLGKDDLCVRKKYIDNAPTVEFPNYGGQVVPDMLQGWKYEEKPKGEWKQQENIFITEQGIEQPYIRTVCSNCNQSNKWGDVPYCPWCGASMRETYEETSKDDPAK